jgi:hypothetical protein
MAKIEIVLKSIKINRTLHPYRERGIPLSQEAISTALNQNQRLIIKNPALNRGSS